MATTMATWDVQGAMARLSEVIERARTEGLRAFTREGDVRAVPVLIEDYNALTSRKPNFKAHLLRGPKFDEFSITRDADTERGKANRTRIAGSKINGQSSRAPLARMAEFRPGHDHQKQDTSHADAPPASGLT